MEKPINIMKPHPVLDGLQVYTSSRVAVNGSEYAMVRKGNERFLLVGGDLRSAFEGDDIGDYKVGPLSLVNNQTLRRELTWLNPTAIDTASVSFGMGDRLGRATIGHLAAIRGTGAQPVLAQQSVRELTLTGRTFDGVLADAVWGVFQIGFRDRFGADGDHLKTAEAVDEAIRAGYNMITLDCSDRIRNDIYKMDGQERDRLFQTLPDEQIKTYKARYLDRPLPIGSVDEATLIESVLVYAQAIEFANEIFQRFLKDRPDISFEVSVDETDYPTTEFAHYFVANELIEHRGVRVVSLAPRFVGEFQKGIDYMGDLSQFEAQLTAHQAIADLFGYKISFHSGSDKFSIFPSAARITKERYHLKTAGTSWLEFVHMVSIMGPELFRELYHFSLANLDRAKKSYHVNVTPESCPAIEQYAPENYRALLSDDNARQLLHINYGNILQQLQDGVPVFKSRLTNLLDREEEAYHQIIRAHFIRHLESLGLRPSVSPS